MAVVVVVRKAINSGSNSGWTAAYNFTSQAAALPERILEVILLSLHRISSSNHILHVIPNAGCEARCYNVVCVGSMVPHSQSGESRDPIMHGRIKSFNTSRQAIYFNPSYSGQAHFNRLGIRHGYESTKPGFILTVFRVPSLIRPLDDIRLMRNIQLSSKPEIGHLYTIFWPSIPSSQVASEV